MKDPNKEGLKHALAALGDGSGHHMWGPGPVGARLHEKGLAQAAAAFDMAAIVAVQLKHGGRKRMTRTIRLLAPVLLEAIQGDDAG